MAVVAKVFRAADPGLAALAEQATASQLQPGQMEHDIDWLTESDHGHRVSAGVLGLYRDDRLQAYVPFRYRSDGLLFRFANIRLGRMPYRIVELFGPGVIAHDEALVDEALTQLQALPWPYHAVAISETPTDSPLWRAVQSGRGAFRTIERERTVHHVVDLPRGFDEYLERFSAKTRSTWKRKARKLEEGGTLSLRVYRRPDEVQELLSTVDPVCRLTYHYHLLGRQLSPSNRQLMGNLTRWAERGWLRGYVLFSGERAIAYVIGCVVRRRFSYDLPGYDPRLAAHSPGIILLLRLIEDLIRDDAADVLDFGGGHADYKKLLATRSYDEASALLIRPTPYAQGIAYLQRGMAATARAGARMLERHQLKSRAKNWLRSLRLHRGA